MSFPSGDVRFLVTISNPGVSDVASTECSSSSQPIPRSTRPLRNRALSGDLLGPGGGMDNPLWNTDIVSNVLAFVDDEEFLFVAVVARAWRECWGGRPRWTRAVRAETSEAQLLSSFGCGLRRSAAVSGALARLGKLQLLQRAHQAGCPLTDRSSRGGVTGGLSVEWAMGSGFTWRGERDDACAAAAQGGHLRTLQWLRENGCPWNSLTCRRAAEEGHLHVLQWARIHGCPWDGFVCAGAARGGRLDVLQWARANDCPWDSRTCTEAAREGHLEILQWARVNGCPWDSWTCAGAAQRGHLDVLQWLRANGCPWDGTACTGAAEGGHLGVLKWARANGCPWERSECVRVAEMYKRSSVLEWATNN